MCYSADGLSTARWNIDMRIAERSVMMNGTTPNASIRVAIYARVSSDQQAQQQTIASQVDALRERIAAD